MENAWRVKLHRRLLDNPIASNGNLLGFLCYLILSASHKDHSFYLWLTKIEQRAGQMILSQKKLAKYFKVSISTIHSRLIILCKERIIETKACNKYTVVTLLNREKYQGDWNLAETKKKPKRNLAETIKNDKNDKNDNIYNYRNSKNITVHKKETKQIKKAIEHALIEFTEAEIIGAIDNYANIYLSEKTYREHKRTLEEFLKRPNALPVMMHKSVKDYLKRWWEMSITDGRSKEADDLFNSQEKWIQEQLKSSKPPGWYRSASHLQNYIDAVLSKKI